MGKWLQSAIDSPTRGDALLDVFLVRPESSVTSSGIVQGVSDHQAVILKVKWEDMCREPHVERIVPVYKKTDVSGLQTFLRDKFAIRVNNGSSVEEIWNNSKNIVYVGIERFVTHKILRKIRTPNIPSRR